MNVSEFTIQNMKSDFVELGILIQDMLLQCYKSLTTSDLHEMKNIYEIERIFIQQSKSFDERCLQYLACKQPLGKDLRIIFALIKLNRDLKMISEYIIKIFNKSLELTNTSYEIRKNELSKMCKHLQTQLQFIVDQLFSENTHKVKEVLNDFFVQAGCNTLHDEVIQQSSAKNWLHIPVLLNIFYCLERIAEYYHHFSLVIVDSLEDINGENR